MNQKIKAKIFISAVCPKCDDPNPGLILKVTGNLLHCVVCGAMFDLPEIELNEVSTSKVGQE